MEKETLEEAAERNHNEQKLNTYTPYSFNDAFKDGAKWQAERMYSKEDMAEAFIACWKVNVPNGIECKVSFNELFEEFKKK